MAELIVDLAGISDGYGVADIPVTVRLQYEDVVASDVFLAGPITAKTNANGQATFDIPPSSDFEKRSHYFVTWPGSNGYLFTKLDESEYLTETENFVPFVPRGSNVGFVDLYDTPISYEGHAGRAVRVAPGEGGLIFSDSADDATVVTAEPVSGTGSVATPVTIADGALNIVKISATGAASATTFLRGDGTWATVMAGALTSPPVSGDGTAGDAITIADSAIGIAKISAGGTAGDTTYLRGDGQWVAPTIVTSAPVSGNGATGTPVTIVDGAIGIAKLSTTGSALATTYLAGDGSWKTTPIDNAQAILDKIVAGTTGDITFSRSGTGSSARLSGSINAGKVTHADLATSAVEEDNIKDAQVSIAKIKATGSASATTYLRGDGTWATVSTSSGGLTSVATAAPVSGTGVDAQNAVTIADGAIGVAKLAGTKSATTYLRGDGTWATPADTSTVHTSTPVSGDGSSATPVTIADAAIALAKLATTGTANATAYLRGDGAWTVPPDTKTVVTASPVSGTGTSADKITIADNTIDIAKIKATGSASGTTYLRGDGTWATVSTSSGGLTSVATAAPVSGTGVDAQNAVTIADAAIALAKLATTGTADATTYLRGDGAWSTPADTSTVHTSAPVSGDGSSATPVTIANNAITHAKLAGNAVEEDNIANDAVSANKIKSNAVTTNKIAASQVDSGKLVESQRLPAIAAGEGGQVVTAKSDRTGFELTTKASGGGTTWHNFTSAPTAGDGEQGDYGLFVNADNRASIWEKTSATLWVQLTDADVTATVLDGLSGKAAGKYLTVNAANDGYEYMEALAIPDWAGLPAGYVIPERSFIIDAGALYHVLSDQIKGQTGPNADPTNYQIVDNYSGLYVAAKYYAQGETVTTAAGKIAMAKVNVIPSDPAPGHADDVKWLILADTRDAGETGNVEFDLKGTTPTLHLTNTTFGVAVSELTPVVALEFIYTRTNTDLTIVTLHPLSEFEQAGGFRVQVQGGGGAYILVDTADDNGVEKLRFGPVNTASGYSNMTVKMYNVLGGISSEGSFSPTQQNIYPSVKPMLKGNGSDTALFASDDNAELIIYGTNTVTRRWFPRFHSDPSLTHTVTSDPQPAFIGDGTTLPTLVDWGTQLFPDQASYPLALDFRFGAGNNWVDIEFPGGNYILEVGGAIIFTGDWSGRNIGVEAFLEDSSNTVYGLGRIEGLTSADTRFDIKGVPFHLPGDTFLRLVLQPFYTGSVVASGATATFANSQQYTTTAQITYGVPTQTTVYPANRPMLVGGSGVIVAPDDTSNTITFDVHGDGDFNPSRTIIDLDDEAVLASPGVSGLWAGASPGARGQVVSSQIPFTHSGGSQNFSDLLTVGSLPATLAQFMHIEDTNLLQWDLIPDGISMSIAMVWTNPLAGNTITVKMQLLHNGGTTQTNLLTWNLTIPGTASAQNPAMLTQTIDLSGITFKQNDEIGIEVSRTSGTANEATVFGALTSTLLHIGLDGEPIDPKDYDTYPVQSRPFRDERSIDYTDPSGVEYTFHDQTFSNNTGNYYQPLAGTAAPTTGGDGWTIDNSAPRGHNAKGTDIVLTRATRLDLQYDAKYSFNDRNNDPGNPDSLTVAMLLQPAGTSGGADGFQNTTQLGSATFTDLVSLDGDVTGTIDVVHRVATWASPDNLSEKLSYRTGLVLAVGGGITARATGIQIVTTGARRMKIGMHGEFVSDPGELDFSFTTLESDWGRGAHPFTVNKRAKDIWSGPNPTRGAPSTFDEDLWDSSGGHLGIHSRWALMFTGHNRAGSAQWNVAGLSQLFLDVTWWGDDNIAQTQTITVKNRAFAIGDRICLRTSNTTRSTHSRNITAGAQKFSVANAADVAGRQVSIQGGFIDRQYQANSISDNTSAWWLIDDDKNIVARRDIRKATLTITGPTAPTTLTVWRESALLATRERIAMSLRNPFATSTLAVTAGERFIITADRDLDATQAASVNCDAQTLQTIPAVQTAVKGIYQTETWAQLQIPSARTNRWRRIPLSGNKTWGEARTLHLYVSGEYSHSGQYKHLMSVPTVLLISLSPLPADRLDTAVTNTDQFIGDNIVGWSYVVVAPLADGGVAIAYTSRTAAQNIIIYAE